MRTRSLRFVWMGLGLTVSFAACSGANDSDFFAGPVDDRSIAPGGDGFDAGKLDAGRKDAGGQPPRDDAGPVDASRPPIGILCGDIEHQPTYCAREKEYCCVASLVTTPVRTCAVRGGLDLCTGIKVGCDGANDCKRGEVCCGTYSIDRARYTSIECTPRKECAITEDSSVDNVYAVFCDPNAEEDECASSRETCIPSSSIKGYSVCGRRE
ncbi:hypothetical protein [Pendulispora albinea]|uniref:Uncharacterized protein n=1 Tax=Pendulispora albinea TaxID=2741071 RepID=A0ABZ2LU07_9BACT